MMYNISPVATNTNDCGTQRPPKRLGHGIRRQCAKTSKVAKYKASETANLAGLAHTEVPCKRRSSINIAAKNKTESPKKPKAA
jgi:hypothetical protein